MNTNRISRILTLLLALVLTLALFPTAARADYQDTVYFPPSYASNCSIVDSLQRLGYSCTYADLKKIAAANDVQGYRGTAEQNLFMLSLLRDGRLVRPQDFPAPIVTAASQAAPSTDLRTVSGWYQVQNMCTSSATTALLRRAQAADGRNVTFTFSDIRHTLGSWQYSDGTWSSVDFGFEQTWTSANGDRYQTRYSTSPQSTEDLVNYLNKHPEGILVYAIYYSGRGRHAIVISDYEWTAESGYRFYCYDPAVNNGNRISLDQSLLYLYSNSSDGTGGSLWALLRNVVATVTVVR